MISDSSSAMTSILFKFCGVVTSFSDLVVYKETTLVLTYNSERETKLGHVIGIAL